jgi:DNA repair protein RadA/Sms
MTAKGLKQVENPSERFLAERSLDMPGSSVVAQLEGSRPLMTEFQALCQKCFVGFPKRTVQGVDANRISVLLAVIEKSLGLSFSDQEVYCKVASGHRVSEPAADLALLMALVSALENRSLPHDLLFLGEVGLGGELRSFPAVQSRLSEAKAIGMKRVVIPKWLYKEAAEIKGLEIISAQNIKEAYRSTWNSTASSIKKTTDQNEQSQVKTNLPLSDYRPPQHTEFDLDF